MIKFFIVTTYGGTAEEWIDELFSAHSLINCDKWKHFNKGKSLDDLFFDSQNNKSFYGNVGSFTADEVYRRTLLEHTRTPIRTVNLVRHPITRIEALNRHIIRYYGERENAIMHRAYSVEAAKEYLDLQKLVTDNFDVDFGKSKNDAFLKAAFLLRNDFADLSVPGVVNVPYERLRNDIDYFLWFLKYLTDYNIQLDKEFVVRIKNSVASDDLNNFDVINSWDKWQIFLVKNLLQGNAEIIAKYNDLGYYSDIFPKQTDKNSGLLLSVQVPSNRPHQIIKFLDSLQNTANDQSCFEVLINIDKGDRKMAGILDEEAKRRPFRVKYMDTFTGGFYNSWKPINDLISIMDDNAYFMTFLSDEMLFITKGWDDTLKKYVEFYPDNIFRLKASKYRYRNYTDFWECGFAPDSIAFYTRKWVRITGDWAPCFSSDAFQQCVSYYLFTSDPFLREQCYRDVPISELEFEGEGAAIGQTPEQSRKRAIGGIKAWLTLVSYRMQVEAYRRAMHLKGFIVAHDKGIKNFDLKDNFSQKTLQLINKDTGNTIEVFPYKLNRFKIFIQNNFRKINYLRYAGGGMKAGKDTLYNFTYFLSMRYERFRNLHDTVCHIRGRIEEYGIKWVFKSIKNRLRNRLRRYL